MNRLVPLAVVAALAIAVAAAPAPARAMTTDRPDAAESAYVVGLMRLQFETGLEIGVDERDGTDFITLSMPTKLRFGIMDALEIHLESPIFVHERRSTGGSTHTDVYGADLDFGLKIHVIDPDGLVPAIGFLVSVTAPIGSPAVRSDAWLLTPIFAFEWELPLDFGISLNAGFTAPVNEREKVSDIARYAISVSRPLTPVADWLGLFVQFYGESPIDQGDTLLFVGGGATFAVHEQFQLDLYVNGGVVEAAPMIVAGAGLALKL